MPAIESVRRRHSSVVNSLCACFPAAVKQWAQERLHWLVISHPIMSGLRSFGLIIGSYFPCLQQQVKGVSHPDWRGRRQVPVPPGDCTSTTSTLPSSGRPVPSLEPDIPPCTEAES